MLNGTLISELSDPTSGDLVAALADSPFVSNVERIETLYLATLTRQPLEEELKEALSWIESADPSDKAQPLGDLLWALLNSSEFILNR
jgi:hypothetical protein